MHLLVFTGTAFQNSALPFQWALKSSFPTNFLSSKPGMKTRKRKNFLTPFLNDCNICYGMDKSFPNEFYEIIIQLHSNTNTRIATQAQDKEQNMHWAQCNAPQQLKRMTFWHVWKMTQEIAIFLNSHHLGFALEVDTNNLPGSKKKLIN